MSWGYTECVIGGMNGTKEAQDALKDGNLGLQGTHAPGQIRMSELQVPRLRGLRYTRLGGGERGHLD